MNVNSKIYKQYQNWLYNENLCVEPFIDVCEHCGERFEQHWFLHESPYTAFCCSDSDNQIQYFSFKTWAQFLAQQLKDIK